MTLSKSQLRMSPASSVATLFGLEESKLVEYLKALPHTVRYLRRFFEKLTVVLDYYEAYGTLQSYWTAAYPCKLTVVLDH